MYLITYQAYTAYSKEQMYKNRIFTAKHRKCIARYDMISFTFEGYHILSL